MLKNKIVEYKKKSNLHEHLINQKSNSIFQLKNSTQKNIRIC